MKLFIHKIDIFIDVYDNNTVSQEPVCFVKALVDAGACSFDEIYIIGKQSKVLQTHKDGSPFIIAITAREMMQDKVLVDCNDVWILWGGWAELINMYNMQDAKLIIDLHHKWVNTFAIKFALCTDMRFPFKETYYLNAGKLNLLSADSGPVLELTQCIYKTETIFNDVKFLPLFMMPTFTNVDVAYRHVNAKTIDLIYATRDWHMLSKSRLQKIIRYYIDTKARSSFLGAHTNVHHLYSMLNEEQTNQVQTTCSFDAGVAFYGVPYAMSYAIAHVAIGDSEYEKFGLMPNRVGEAVAGKSLSFIDESIDKEHVLFGGNKLLESMSYVKTSNDVQYRLQYMKANPNAYLNYCKMQIDHLTKNFDLAKYFYAATYEFCAKHKNIHVCDACYCHL